MPLQEADQSPRTQILENSTQDKVRKQSPGLRLFPVSKPGQLYKDILLRNSGNDNGRTQMRDGFTVSILQNRIDLEYMAYEPAVLFINGRYYGIENLRERSNKDLIYCNYGLEEEDIILDGVPDVDLFPLTPEYGELHQFIEELDMTSDTAFMAVCRRINMENYLHYQLFEIYVGNTDWPHNNFKLWKRKVDGKWRWIVFDLDFGFNGVNDLHIIPWPTPWAKVILGGSGRL